MTVVRMFYCVVSLFASVSSAQVGSPAANAARPQIGAAELREDIAAFRTEFLERDRSYSPAAREQAEARLRQLEQRLDRLTPAAFELGLAQIVALADNGHTLVPPNARARRYNRVPVRLATFGDELRVLRASDANGDLLGGKLVSIDGHTIAELRDSSRTLVSGTARRRDNFTSVPGSRSASSWPR